MIILHTLLCISFVPPDNCFVYFYIDPGWIFPTQFPGGYQWLCFGHIWADAELYPVVIGVLKWLCPWFLFSIDAIKWIVSVRDTCAFYPGSCLVHLHTCNYVTISYMFCNCGHLVFWIYIGVNYNICSASYKIYM